MKRVLVLAALLIAACGPGRYYQRIPVRGPDGSRAWYAIECRFRIDCVELAGSGCRYGYEIREDNGKSARATMLVRCNDAPGASSRLSSRAYPE